MTDRETGERGAAAITVAISLLVLMGFVALAMDGGLGFDDRRGTQNAADNAALAAAWEACNPSVPTTDPKTAALAVAAENGYDDAADDTLVTVNPLSATQYEVIIETTNDATFARAGVGADSVSVTSRAVAHCEEHDFLDGYAIFAGAEHCASGGSIELDLTGSTKTINGGIFSNGDMKINGPNTTVNGEIEYRGTFNSNAGVPGTQYFGSPKGYPLDLSIEDFRPGGRYRNDYPSNFFFHPTGGQIDNSWMKDNGYANSGAGNSIIIKQSGIYYTSNAGNDAIKLTNVSTLPGVTVTFVSEGTMHITGNANVSGFAPVNSGGYSPVLFFSNAGSPPACNTTAIQFSGSSMTWTGLMYAPNGEVQMSASSSDATINGSIIANTVNISGSNFKINWQDDGAGDPRFTVELNE